MRYLVSIIIPVFNIENYIRKCIDSIISQTLKDIEIILVDDGSTDQSGQICDEYAAKDERITVLHKNNAGLSAARNDGIRISTAPYIMFVDGDDWVDPDYCEAPYRMACENHADLVLFSYKRVYQDGTVKKNNSNRKSGILTKDEAIRFNVFDTWAIWIGLYGRAIFDKETFPEGKLHEDTAAAHRFIHAANTICFLNKNLYNYRMNRAGSIMTDAHTRNHPDLREMLVRKTFDLSDWGYREYAQLFAMRVLISYGSNKDEAKKFARILNTGKVPDFFSRNYKLMLHLYRLSPAVFEAVCKITGKRNNA